MEKTETMPQTEQPAMRVARRKKGDFFGRHWKKIGVFVAVLIVIIGSGIAGHAYGDKIAGRFFSNNESGSNSQSKAAGELKELPKIVAVVNNEQITKDQFQTRVNLSSQSYAAQGVDVNTSEAQTQIRENVIQNLINERIILQYAAKDGISATQESVDQQFNTFVEQTGGQDKFKEAIKTQGITEEYVRNDIKIQLTTQEYLNQKVNFSGIDPTDEEVAAAYETAKSQVQDQSQVPPLEEAAEDLKAQLIAQERNNRANAYVQSLRDNSSVQILF